MTWGGLNPALTAWREGILTRFPKRGSQSDGGYADAAHGSTSQHQPDADGTVDAFDCDVNFLGSTVPAGSAVERQFCEALKADFEADPRSQLWIHQREIANRDVGAWAEREYDGANPHDKHIHFQSRQSLERDGRPWSFARTDALRRDLGMTAPTAGQNADAVWDEPVKLPDGRTVSMRTIMQWSGAAELDTRAQIKAEVNELDVPVLETRNHTAALVAEPSESHPLVKAIRWAQAHPPA